MQQPKPLPAGARVTRSLPGVLCVALCLVAGCNCAPGPGDAGWTTDAHRCSLEEANGITPIERASSIGGNELLRLFGADRVSGGAGSVYGSVLADGSLVIGASFEAQVLPAVFSQSGPGSGATLVGPAEA